jgi:hypothetical protein
MCTRVIPHSVYIQMTSVHNAQCSCRNSLLTKSLLTTVRPTHFSLRRAVLRVVHSWYGSCSSDICLV